MESWITLFAWRLAALSVVGGLAMGVVCAAGAETQCSLEPGRSEHKLQAGDLERRYVLEVGPRAGVGSPLVFIWHGWGGQSDRMIKAIDPARHWPEAIVVAADGMSRRFENFGFFARRGWQIEEGEFDNRDLALFDRMLEDLLATGCVDPARVYSAGFSNGASFSNLLGCSRSKSVRAIAPVAGTLSATSCEASVPAVVTHGTGDEVVGYEFGRQTFAHWARQNGCEPPPEPVPDGCVSATGCEAETVFCSFDGSHRWPGRSTPPIVEFLKRQ